MAVINSTIDRDILEAAVLAGAAAVVDLDGNDPSDSGTTTAGVGEDSFAVGFSALGFRAGSTDGSSVDVVAFGVSVGETQFTIERISINDNFLFQSFEEDGFEATLSILQDAMMR